MPWATLTHARVRAAQGDVEGARRILGELLSRDPGDRAARDLLEELRDRAGRSPGAEGREEILGAPCAADPGGLSRRFRRALARDRRPSRDRIRRLESWLARISSAGRR